MSVFERFYTSDPVEVLKLTESGAYDKKRKWEKLGAVKADIQPYGGDLANREYGIQVVCRLRMFCDNESFIAVGNYVRHDGRLYRIRYVAPWAFGSEVLLDEYTID